MWPWSSTTSKQQRHTQQCWQAIHNGEVEKVQSLLRRQRVDVNIHNERGRTFLHDASDMNHTRIVKLLCQANADPNTKTKEGSTALHCATKKGFVEIVEVLLQAHADPNAKNQEEQTSLHIAAHKGHVRIVELLLHAHADLNAQNKDGWTPLLSASDKGRTQVVELLLKATADPNAKDKNGRTSLHFASNLNHAPIIESLLTANAEPNTGDKDGGTPLHMACHKNHTKVIALLLNAKADPNAKEMNGRTPLHLAVRKGHVRAVELLLKVNADPNVKAEDGRTPLDIASDKDHAQVVDLLLNTNADPNLKTKNQRTALHVAAYNGHARVVELLLNAKADPNLQDEDKRTPLHIASDKDYMHIVELLLMAKADPNVKDKEERTPLLIASAKGRIPVVNLLLRANADPNAKEKEEWTALHYGSSIGVVQVVRLLLDAQADLNATNSDEVTPLHIASLRGHADVVDVLLKASADPNIHDKDGQTPLHAASDRNYIQVVESLLRHQADPNAKDKNERTPLHSAADWDFVQLMELLLRSNADVNAKDKNTRTPLHIASERGHKQAVELLLTAKADLNVKEKFGLTPLHCACHRHHYESARTLLLAGANLHSKDYIGHEPLQWCIQLEGHIVLSERTLQTLQVLVSFGATWDSTCDDMVNLGTARKESTALRICVLLWTEEHSMGLHFTEIPTEVVKRGFKSVETYIKSLKASRENVFRAKICLVGSSCAGKTSFVKSILTEQPCLVHIDNRTIGIDQFPLRFVRVVGDRVKIYEVTFWDFAGQDAYQVAHSLFFSRRTVFFVFIDTEAFSVAYMQAVISAEEMLKEELLMNEFIERTVMRWIRMILARQPDAQFVFTATKEDSLVENNATERLLKDALEEKLAEVEAEIHEIKHKLLTGEHDAAVSVGRLALPFRPRKDIAIGTHNQPNVVYMSCTTQSSVQKARARVEDIIGTSERCFQMPDNYSQVLNTIVKLRTDAALVKDASIRITRVFVPFDKLPSLLKIDPALCRIILQTLHDLGDVLWYETLGIELFRETVVLHPLLLIDYIRQIINHKHTGQILSHADLKALPFWIGFHDHTQIEAMKQMLQTFHLVYSANDNRVMEWDSDLIVPAYWQTKTPASWLFLGDLLRLKTCGSDTVRVHWEFHFEYGLPSALFDHLIVASVSPYITFRAGPDWILFTETTAACRLMVGRDRTTLHRTIHVEAVITETTTHEQAQKLWTSFERLCVAFLHIQSEYRGLVVSSFAWDDTTKKINFKRLVHASASPHHTLSWMPPPETWESIRQKALALGIFSTKATI